MIHLIRFIAGLLLVGAIAGSAWLMISCTTFAAIAAEIEALFVIYIIGCALVE